MRRDKRSWGGGGWKKWILPAAFLAAPVVAALVLALTWLSDPSPVYPGRLRIGVLPDESPAVLQQQYAPLIRYLSARTGLPCELVIPASYADLVRDFLAGRLELAWFGGVTFVQASARGDALPLVMRDIDREFHSYILVRPESPAKSLADLRGTRFAFGPRLSTSGTLMPVYFMRKEGIDPETWFGSVGHAAGHDEAAYQVRDGQVDAGAANAQIVDAMLTDGRLTPADIRILLRTPPYADYVWAIRADIAGETRETIRGAFLSLSTDDPMQTEILDRLGAGFFLPALSSDFLHLRNIVDAMDYGD